MEQNGVNVLDMVSWCHAHLSCKRTVAESFTTVCVIGDGVWR